MILDSTTRSYPGFFLRRGRQLGSPALVVVGRVAWELGMGNSLHSRRFALFISFTYHQEDKRAEIQGFER
jgi:hypothetical protein